MSEIYLRVNYWVIKGRQVVRSACVQCKRYEGQPFSRVMSPDLPSIKVSEDPPFTHVGHDFPGPLTCMSKINQQEQTLKSMSVYLLGPLQEVYTLN